MQQLRSACSATLGGGRRVPSPGAAATWCITLHQRCTFHRNTQLSTNTHKYKHKYIKMKAPQHDFASTALFLGVVHWHHLIAKMQGNTGDYKYTFKQRRIQIHQGQRPSEYKFMIAIDRWILFGKMRAVVVDLDLPRSASQNKMKRRVAYQSFHVADWSYLVADWSY